MARRSDLEGAPDPAPGRRWMAAEFRDGGRLAAGRRTGCVLHEWECGGSRDLLRSRAPACLARAAILVVDDVDAPQEQRRQRLRRAAAARRARLSLELSRSDDQSGG